MSNVGMKYNLGFLLLILPRSSDLSPKFDFSKATRQIQNEKPRLEARTGTCPAII